jgi:hypothetical protein
MNKEEVSLLIKEMMNTITDDHIQQLKDHEDKGVKWGLFFLVLFIIEQMYLVYLIYSK